MTNPLACKFSFDEKEHIYTLDGRRLPGVTTVLEEWVEIHYGSAWFFLHIPSGSKVPGPTFIAARDRGTANHSMFEYSVTGQGVDREALDPSLLPDLDTIEQWVDHYKPEVLLCETPMFHPELLYAGRPDLIFKSKRLKNVALVDAKRGMPGPVGPQTSAYLEMWRKQDKYRGVVDRYCFEIAKGVSGFHSCGKPTDFNFFKMKLWLYQNDERRAA